MNNGGFDFYKPEFTASVTIAAGGAAEVEDIDVQGGVGLTLLGLKDNTFEFVGHDVSNWGAGWQKHS